jgi:predicted dehydrogenase
MPLKVGLVGIGKIARDQHIPALRANPDFQLVACASRNASVEGTAHFADLSAMLAGVPDLDVVSICTPPTAHFDAALLALRSGKHVMLEKPPTSTTRQIALLADEAARHGRTLYQTWHSRHAASVVRASSRAAGSRGRKTSTTGIRGSNGSSMPAASGCSIPGSMRCRC